MRKNRKLVLARETVLNLERSALIGAPGATGVTVVNCPSWYCNTTNGPDECAFACVGIGSTGPAGC